MQRLSKQITVLLTLITLAIVSHFTLPNLSPFVPNNGLKTEARSYNPEKCQQACTVSSQGDHNRSSATRSLLDSTSATIPPGSLAVIFASILVYVYYYLYVKQSSYRRVQLQKEFCIWRF